LARRRNPRGSGERLRTELIEAANAILDRTGDPADVTVRGVAAAVGVAPTAVYLHFADRDTLLTEVVVDRFAAFRAAIDAAVDGIDDARERLRRGHAAYVTFALGHPGHYRMLFGDTGVDPERNDLTARRLEVAAPAFEILVDCCRRCIDAGVFANVDPHEMANSLWAFEHGWVVLRAGRTDLEKAEAEALAGLDVLLAGLGVAPASARQ
jgi:AcrR family transcriptional regulator